MYDHEHFQICTWKNIFFPNESQLHLIMSTEHWKCHLIEIQSSDLQGHFSKQIDKILLWYDSPFNKNIVHLCWKEVLLGWRVLPAIIMLVFLRQDTKHYWSIEGKCWWISFSCFEGYCLIIHSEDKRKNKETDTFWFFMSWCLITDIFIFLIFYLCFLYL